MLAVTNKLLPNMIRHLTLTSAYDIDVISIYLLSNVAYIMCMF